MKKVEEDVYTCTHCNNDVKNDDEYCIHCGSILIEGVQCNQHSKDEAEGICIICGNPCCKKCGAFINNMFLCNEHSAYEIYEGMARVFGGSDGVQVEFAKSSLESAGLHPFIFSRKGRSTAGSSPEYTLFRSSGDYDGHIINEFKLMVPCQEVLDAQEKLRKLKFTI